MEGIRGSTGKGHEARPGRSAQWPRFRRSLSYAVNGLRHVWSHHPNLRLELGLFIICFALALVLAVPPLLIVTVAPLLIVTFLTVPAPIRLGMFGADDGMVTSEVDPGTPPHQFEGLFQSELVVPSHVPFALTVS